MRKCRGVGCAVESRRHCDWTNKRQERKIATYSTPRSADMRETEAANIVITVVITALRATCARYSLVCIWTPLHHTKGTGRSRKGISLPLCTHQRVNITGKIARTGCMNECHSCSVEQEQACKKQAKEYGTQMREVSFHVILLPLEERKASRTILAMKDSKLVFVNST